jgi:rhodanese-related sulfurtransferase
MKKCQKQCTGDGRAFWAGMVWILMVSFLTAWMSYGSVRETLPVDFSPGSQVRDATEAEGFMTIDFVGAQNLVESGGVLVFDARPASDYHAGHVPTALSLPISDFEHAFIEHMPMLQMGMPLMVYCTGPECDEALQLAIRLREAGFEDPLVYLGGWEEWTRKTGGGADE